MISWLPFHPTCVGVHVHSCCCSRGVLAVPSTRVLLMEGGKFPLLQQPVPTNNRVARLGRRAKARVPLRPPYSYLQDGVPSSSRRWTRCGRWPRHGGGPGGRALGPRGAVCCPMGRRAAERGRGVPGFLLLRPDPRAPALCGPARRSFRFPFPLPSFPWRPGSVSGLRRTRRGTRRASGGMTPPGRKTTTRTRTAMKVSPRERRRPPGRSRRIRRSRRWARRGNPGRPRWVPAGPAGSRGAPQPARFRAGGTAAGRGGRRSPVCTCPEHPPAPAPAPQRVSPCPCIFLAQLLSVLPVFFGPFFLPIPIYSRGLEQLETERVRRFVCLGSHR